MSAERILVVGQGLTGSVLALALLERGHKVWIVDEGREHTSSKVAAGLFNPVLVGRKKTTWLSDTLFPYFGKFYTKAEELLQIRFFQPAPLLHLCRDMEEQNDWDILAGTEQMAKWVHFFSGKIPSYIKAEYGAFQINSAGWVNLPVFLAGVKELFLTQKRYLYGSPEIGEDIVGNGKSYSYQGADFDRVFLCRGEFERNFPVFDTLPHNPVKGQVLDIETGFDLEETIFHKQVFLLPSGRRKARVGATYTWENLNYKPEETETEYLRVRLGDFLKGSYKITGQKAGVRPAVHGRKPVLGEHPDYKGLYVLNGMGSKGVTLAPFCVQVLLQHIYEGNTGAETYLFPFHKR